jgi:asparagine synthase (glutamine-hydrolysing)
MWLRVNLETFDVDQSGFVSRSDGPMRLYVSPGQRDLQRIEELADSEFAQAVEVDSRNRTVAFGRDYLGQYPLSYACSARSLCISDDVSALLDALRSEGIEPTLSPEALALYFAAGFVPHGMTPFREVVNCEATCLYRWEKGAVRKISTFRPIEPDASFPLAGVGEAIEREVEKCARMSEAIDVWCSGGIDSSIMAHCFNTGGRRARLLTLSFGDQIRGEHGEGERPYAQIMADAVHAPLQDVLLSERKFDDMHTLFMRTFNAPVIDLPVAPKFALAEESRGLVITGEGGDNLFGGPKNNHMLYALSQDPSARLGWLFALAHKRFVAGLPEIFRHGKDLLDRVIEYFDAQLAAYPGDLVRKLFYLNTLFKPSSMIFAQSYYPGQTFNLTFRHPLFALEVYKAAFTLSDEKKYSFPATKIALTELYGARLPQAIVKRKKSGTQIPLFHYMRSLSGRKLDFSPLADSGLFQEEFLERMRGAVSEEETASRLQYGVINLNAWLQQRQSAQAAFRPRSAAPGIAQSRASASA